MLEVAPLDVGRLDGFLRGAMPGLAGVPRIERIAGGQSNPTFFVTYAERRLVVRKQPPGDLLPSAHAIDREYRVMSALAGTAVPVPRMLLYCDDRAVLGTPFYVMERLDGRVFHDCTLPGVTPAERGRMYASMAETLAALHSVDPAAVGLADFGRAGGYFARQIARWTRQWQIARTREDAHIDRLAAWLPLNVPDDYRSAISHGDYRIGNLMFHATEPRVIAILDWELSTLGHPLADLAHNCMAWQTPPEEYGGLLGLKLAELGLPEQADYEARYYAAAPGTSRLTAFHMAFALFRWSVIFEGIAARAASGNAAAENAAEVGRLSAAFARRVAALIPGSAIDGAG
jgi:aminoglycoside phosphotransferase (APT) family kinase protein